MVQPLDNELSQVVLAFLKNHSLMAVATVNEAGRPEAAAVTYAERSNLELVFETLATTDKCRNLLQNPAVACVVWDTAVTVQYRGVARELADDESETVIGEYVAKNPLSRKLVGVEGAKFFKVVPSYIRYTNVSVTPWQVLELKLPQNV